MPPGAIATLIMTTGLRRGFAPAAAAGLGAASVDFGYALSALLLGSAVSAMLAGAERTLQLATGVTLVVIGMWTAVRSRRAAAEQPTATAATRDLVSTYLRFAGLTAANPATLGYFVAIAIGLGGTAIQSLPAFALGVFTASAAWQLLLATISGALHGRLPPSARAWASLGGSLIVVLLGVAVLARALSA